MQSKKIINKKDMWTIIILMTIGLIIGIGLAPFADVIEYLICGVEGLIIGIILGIVIALFIPSKIETVLNTYYLESLQDNNNIEGSFFLGSGSINGRMKYIYYYKVDDGFRMGESYYNNVLIRYTTENPRIEVYREVKTDAFINKFSFWVKGCDNNETNIIYIPKGSIKQNYNLDLK